MLVPHKPSVFLHSPRSDGDDDNDIEVIVVPDRDAGAVVEGRRGIVSGRAAALNRRGPPA